MFYLPECDDVLRFGDVLAHQTTIASTLKRKTEPHDEFGLFRIDVRKPSYSVVLTPCCSIGGNNMIVISPFAPIDPFYFKNPYLKDDLTRINRKMLAEQSMPPSGWERLSPEEKMRKLEEGELYALLEKFVYDKNDLFLSYKIKLPDNIEKEINSYEIDFRNVSIINSEDINSPDGAFLTNKIAQLTIEMRSELREKISFFYGRIPDEDVVDID